ncbi:hypothetical protein INP51_09140 [Blautia liquoris]|jgi:hypothetical protein|uniref:Uncharacterized protein n=1 Tax=Blautia liquoris TaxID=2779518 RepID=A0A7M2RE07_9FIRM|nr:hypothetical protein [Blautia liquoris]QOV18204.1 hypothetical protein INP51_09140 [Blautia liquoris]HCA30456.1 hypothetical protein [Oscillospiraceae bacterium]
MKIREIEKIIDAYHNNHPVFVGNKQQVTYELLASFEDLCSLAVMSSMLNPFALKKITDYMDALNQALNWLGNSTLALSEEKINSNLSEERYKECTSFLTHYAYPYSLICSGYISFSRKRLDARVEGNKVTFIFPENANKSAWSDIMREANQSNFAGFMESINPVKLSSANTELQKRITIQDEQLCYELSAEILDTFKDVAEKQWDSTKTLPDLWKFDLFTLAEYKQVWVAIATLCYIHFFSCLSIKDALVRLKNSTIIQPIGSIADYIVSTTNVQRDTVLNIINYITFEDDKHNVDIVYQPIVILPGEIVVIAPMLFMGSRPERNLLSVVSSKTDFEHSKEVNDLEDLMVQEIEAFISHKENLKVIKHKKLEGRLPDIDLGLFDVNTNAVLLCELKWFMAADSSKEVYAREDDITHGCEQSGEIMAYAMSNKRKFMKHVFDVDDCEAVDLFCCVVARHNIRTQNKYVPVIDLKKLKELLSTKPLNSVFHTIRNHEYEESLPNDTSITYQTVEYGGYTFEIPAICFGSMPE